MKQELNAALGPKIDPKSYNEAASLRDQIQKAQLNDPISHDLNALGEFREFYTF